MMLSYSHQNLETFDPIALDPSSQNNKKTKNNNLLLREICDLNCSFNSLRFASDFQLLTQLIRLDISHNRITSLKLLPLRLRFLNVSHNELTSLDGCQALMHLDTLLASHNQLCDLEHVPASSAFRVIDVSYNRLTSLAELVPSCSSLVVVRAEHNLLRQPNDVAALGRIKTLRVVALSGNVACNKPEWSGILENMLHQVEDFDGSAENRIVGRIQNSSGVNLSMSLRERQEEKARQKLQQEQQQQLINDSLNVSLTSPDRNLPSENLITFSQNSFLSASTSSYNHLYLNQYPSQNTGHGYFDHVTPKISVNENMAREFPNCFPSASGRINLSCASSAFPLQGNTNSKYPFFPGNTKDDEKTASPHHVDPTSIVNESPRHQDPNFLFKHQENTESHNSSPSSSKPLRAFYGYTVMNKESIQLSQRKEPNLEEIQQKLNPPPPNSTNANSKNNNNTNNNARSTSRSNSAFTKNRASASPAPKRPSVSDQQQPSSLFLILSKKKFLTPQEKRQLQEEEKKHKLNEAAKLKQQKADEAKKMEEEEKRKQEEAKAEAIRQQEERDRMQKMREQQRREFYYSEDGGKVYVDTVARVADETRTIDQKLSQQHKYDHFFVPAKNNNYSSSSSSFKQPNRQHQETNNVFIHPTNQRIIKTVQPSASSSSRKTVTEGKIHTLSHRERNQFVDAEICLPVPMSQQEEKAYREFIQQQQLQNQKTSRDAVSMEYLIREALRSEHAQEEDEENLRQLAKKKLEEQKVFEELEQERKKNEQLQEEINAMKEKEDERKRKIQQAKDEKEAKMRRRMGISSDNKTTATTTTTSRKVSRPDVTNKIPTTASAFRRSSTVGASKINNSSSTIEIEVQKEALARADRILASSATSNSQNAPVRENQRQRRSSAFWEKSKEGKALSKEMEKSLPLNNNEANQQQHYSPISQQLLDARSRLQSTVDNAILQIAKGVVVKNNKKKDDEAPAPFLSENRKNNNNFNDNDEKEYWIDARKVYSLQKALEENNMKAKNNTADLVEIQRRVLEREKFVLQAEEIEATESQKKKILQEQQAAAAAKLAASQEKRKAASSASANSRRPSNVIISPSRSSSPGKNQKSPQKHQKNSSEGETLLRSCEQDLGLVVVVDNKENKNKHNQTTPSKNQRGGRRSSSVVKIISPGSEERKNRGAKKDSVIISETTKEQQQQQQQRHETFSTVAHQLATSILSPLTPNRR